jgi:hypothetical protein
MACVQYCSKQAFEVKSKPMNKERYVNLFVSKKEVIDFHQGNTKSSIYIRHNCEAQPRTYLQ